MPCWRSHNMAQYTGYGTIRYGMVRYSMVRYSMVRYSMVRYSMVKWYCIVWCVVCGVVWCGLARYYMRRHALAWHDIRYDMASLSCKCKWHGMWEVTHLTLVSSRSNVTYLESLFLYAQKLRETRQICAVHGETACSPDQKRRPERTRPSSSCRCSSPPRLSCKLWINCRTHWPDSVKQSLESNERSFLTKQSGQLISHLE